MNIEIARFNMIEQQIRPWEVLDPAILSLLATVRREDFVPPAMRALAFVDTQVPLLPGEPDGPRMLEPKQEARLLQELQVQRHEKVLEIGTGSGFMAALLAHRAMQVHTLECRPELVRMARDSLRRNGIANVSVHEVSAAAGARGLPGEAPFDAIVLSGSVAEVPPVLLTQLKVGGRLVAVVGELPMMRARLFKRVGDAAWSDIDLFDTVAPRLAGFNERTRFHF
ncbi:MAG: protein-L-isoaspartate O-methyltransferase [Rubrivivax sp.]|jgi:protein-L-isoaspartate(D-aspartate) O-methyltransferase|nr:protein-L-isoaspartate O-methyltransferase [Betaproteobacteria bacterium]MBP6317039.1 protein-L-isoaspartate O-methyltransferase [Rubrivivax sp.]MBK7278075.1 protein-L-isoaspartate O-methyltransferase [Betaproteobacteria bacterium]MBK7456994.1 protein-L-isoaspartate O-methyltransferase [Betaproteobacteria bacterium]MBK7518274.1 protein-L-isoaspartate O-methyltransferase [Betaproteobacteria bacterium]